MKLIYKIADRVFFPFVLRGRAGGVEYSFAGEHDVRTKIFVKHLMICENGIFIIYNICGFLTKGL